MTSAARRRRRLRPGRLLRRGRAPRERRAAGRGRPDRAAADAVGARPPRRRARPPEHQGGLARVREDRGHSRASASSATSRSGATSRTRSSPSVYDAVVYAFGAQTDRQLGIPGEDLPGSWPATAFVAWYNGHPDFQDLEFDLSHERAVVIGNGNVALDVARMLALTPEELAPTDTTDAAIDAINAAGVREILVLGRRGPVQAAWTPVELGELGELAGADILVDPADLELDAASEAELEAAPPTVKRATSSILREYAQRAPEGKPRAIRLRFLALARRDPRRRAGRGDRGRPQRARRRRGGGRADGRARDDPVRNRLPQRRLPRRRAPGRAVRRAPRHDPERGRPRARRGRCPGPGRLLRRLDQARPERRDRHEQEGRDRDGRAPARGCARRAAATARRRTRTSTSSSPSAASTSCMYAGWEAIDAPERARGRAARPAAGQARSWDELLGPRVPARATDLRAAEPWLDSAP